MSPSYFGSTGFLSTFDFIYYIFICHASAFANSLAFHQTTAFKRRRFTRILMGDGRRSNPTAIRGRHNLPRDQESHEGMGRHLE